MMKRPNALNRKWWLAGMTVLIAAVFAGCGSAPSEQPQSQASGEPAGQTAGETASAEGANELKIRFYDDPAGFDPANVFRIENENIAFNVFSGLTSYDSATGAIVPDLAESWETPDNKVWTFRLRQGVQWQKGFGEFTAQDVIYTYERNIDPATASPYATDLANVEKVEAPDDYTVVYTLKEPDSNFLHVVANYHQGQIVKKEAIEKAGDNVKWDPVGTGPYMVESIDPSSQIVLKRHEQYYKGPAPIEKLIFNIIKDEQTATIALQNGEVDVLMRANRQENLDILEQAGFKMNAVENYAANLKVFNMEHPALKDKRVRQAWYHAVDFQTIVDATAPSLQSVGKSILLDWMDVYSDDIPKYEYDPEKAKRLLAEAGFPNGFTVTQLQTSSNGVTEQMQLEQEYLAQVGIQLEFELVDSPTYTQRRNDGEFETATRLLPAVNPDMILLSFLHPDNIAPAGLNGARFDMAEVTEKMELARAEVDPAKRKQLYADIQRIAMDELPYLPAYTSNVYWPSQPWVDGVVINKLAQVNFHGVDMNK